MHQIGFDNEKYISMQSQKIKERINNFDGKLYLEFGGKLFDDYHASRVLPGFKPDNKIKMLLKLKDDIEIIISINSEDIEKNKTRGDLGITYDIDTLRLIDSFRGRGLKVSSVILTRYNLQPAADNFKKRLESLGIKVYKHYTIEGYPSNIKKILSEAGLGQNEYVETDSKLIVVTAPGPGSGKMATCISQMYHDNKRGIKSGYAKFETFPIWNIPLNHPVNLAYEAATADLNDINMIDPFHLEAYNKTSINYNRDIEIFPVLKTAFENIMGYSTYKSPTDMGVNMAGFCIVDDEAVKAAANQEIIRRYYKALCDKKKGLSSNEEIYKLELLLESALIGPENRAVIAVSEKIANETASPAVAIALSNGKIITGKTSDLLGATCAAILNSLKELAGIPDEKHLIDPKVIAPIQQLKTKNFKAENPRLHLDEMLIALAISAVTDTDSLRAFEKLDELFGCEAHSSVILSEVDSNVLKKLGINITFTPEYETPRFFMS